MTGISYRNISKNIDDGAEFRSFSLDIDAGEFVVLVGHNGCGKAELIRMAEGYGGRYSGDVLIDGRRVTRNSRGHNMASVVTDVPIIGTPRMEMNHILRKMGIERSGIIQRISEAAELTGVSGVLDVRYSKLDPEMR